MGNNYAGTPYGRATDPAALISAAQDFTNAWAQLGTTEIDCRKFNNIGAFLKITANNSLGMRFRIMGRHTTGSSDLFPMPCKVVTGTSVIVSPEYIELATNASQNMVLEFNTDNIIPYAIIQIQAGTVGATAGQVATAHYSRGY